MASASVRTNTLRPQGRSGGRSLSLRQTTSQHPTKLFKLSDRDLFDAQTYVCAASSAAELDPVVVSKERLRTLTQDLDRGIFGVNLGVQSQIHAEIGHLEAFNPCATPTADLHLVEGQWRLLYSTIRILGTRRSKLGLREFVKIGNLWQDIDVHQKTAVNRVEFSVAGFGLLNGALTIRASFTVVSPSRVDVAFDSAVLEPAQLEQLFRKHYDMLLAIFNPEGWLEVTYVDEDLRIGRDDKGNIFVLEKEPAT
jgi:hypothetical protein